MSQFAASRPPNVACASVCYGTIATQPRHLSRPCPATVVRALLVRTLFAGIAMLLCLTTIPFIQSMQPIPSLASATKRVDIATLAPDSFIEVNWKGQWVLIFRPSRQTLDELAAQNGLTKGPKIDATSSPPAFVYHRSSTFRGLCAVVQAERGRLGSDWRGGWMDPCFVGAWDYAGRRVIDANGHIDLPSLTVPEHRFLEGDTEIELL